MLDILLLIFVAITFIIGVIGIVFPVLPSLPIIWLGILVYAIFTNFAQITITTVVITGMLMIVGTLLDFFSSIFGAKAYGASCVGTIFALLGGIIGFIIFNVLGMLLFSFLGAFIGEFIKYQKTHQAIRAGWGTVVGFVLGVVVKIFISFVMIGIFLLAIF